MMEKIDMTPMERALALAKEAAQMGEVPVGAVIVRDSDGMIVGEGYDRRETDRDPTAHAEMTAIRQASAFLGGWRLTGCTMYVTLQPCPMCAGAAMNARLGKVVWGAPDTSQGSYTYQTQGGVMEHECSKVLKSFFAERRRTGSIKLVEVQTDDQFRRLADIADEIWHEYFPAIIGEAQTDYMVHAFCSFDTMKENAMFAGYTYSFIKLNGEDIGYTAVKPDGDRLFLSKLYIKRDHRGNGYARQVIDHHRAFACEHGLRAIWLTVNKGNASSIAAYRAMGFELIGAGKNDIGNNFFMDDYYYELDVTK